MNVSLAVLADYANISREGKLNIMGIFDNINAANIPVAHPQMQLVATIEGAPDDTGKEHPMAIELEDPAGETIFKITAKIAFGKAPTGVAVKASSMIQLNNLVFKEFGRYCFKIQINGNMLKKVPFTVVEVKQHA